MSTMHPGGRIALFLARAVVIAAAVIVAVALTGRLTTLGAMIVGVLIVLAGEVVLFTRRP